ncbi:MAG: hypothetical protein QOI23_54, partial [Chloroflexota bacterium]|nr:hypothetical protein [Chloroflexota bacterium]
MEYRDAARGAGAQPSPSADEQKTHQSHHQG